MDEIEKFIKELKNKFNMKDLEDVRNVLGMRILWDEHLLSLNQAKYAAEIVQEFHYEDGHVFKTPMEPTAATDLENNLGALLDAGEIVAFLRLIGKLGWLCNSRPDILFSVQKIQQFNLRACRNNWKALLRVVEYIADTLEYGLVWRTGSSNDKILKEEALKYALTSKGDVLLAYSDTDSATDPSDRKSITGMAIILSGAAVVFGSWKQKGMSKSTQEAEYIGMSDTVRSVLWAKYFWQK